MVALMWQRQERCSAKSSDVSREAMHELVGERLRRRGEGMVAQLAESLTNPMYYSDLDAIGVLARAALRQPDVALRARVRRRRAASCTTAASDIPAYGQRDERSVRVRGDRRAHAARAEFGRTVVDVSAPIMIGDQRLGGVRVGYSLWRSMRDDRTRADGAMRARLDEIGARHVVWIAMLGAGLLGARRAHGVR